MNWEGSMTLFENKQGTSTNTEWKLIYFQRCIWVHHHKQINCHVLHNNAIIIFNWLFYLFNKFVKYRCRWQAQHLLLFHLSAPDLWWISSFLSDEPHGVLDSVLTAEGIKVELHACLPEILLSTFILVMIYSELSGEENQAIFLCLLQPWRTEANCGSSGN